jgi:hypothetical protein
MRLYRPCGGTRHDQQKGPHTHAPEKSHRCRNAHRGARAGWLHPDVLPGHDPRPSASTVVQTTPATSPSTTTPNGDAAPGSDQPPVGTVVRFSVGSASVDVVIGEDNPATRDFLSMLPLTLTLEEFNGREKIAYLPRELNHDGSPGSDPEDGDLIYYTPWGNLGFYYNASGIGYSDQTIHLGTYEATREELDVFDGQEVTVEGRAVTTRARSGRRIDGADRVAVGFAARQRGVPDLAPRVWPVLHGEVASSRFSSSSAIRRAPTSVLPPASKPTIMVMG